MDPALNVAESWMKTFKAKLIFDLLMNFLFFYNPYYLSRAYVHTEQATFLAKTSEFGASKDGQTDGWTYLFLRKHKQVEKQIIFKRN